MSHEFWSIILIAGLGGWLTSAIMLIWKAFPQRGIFNAAAGVRWGAAVVVCFAVWVAGLLHA